MKMNVNRNNETEKEMVHRAAQLTMEMNVNRNNETEKEKKHRAAQLTMQKKEWIKTSCGPAHDGNDE